MNDAKECYSHGQYEEAIQIYSQELFLSDGSQDHKLIAKIYANR